MTVSIIITVIMMVSAIWFSNAYNDVVKLKNGTEEALATVDVHLEKRYDLIPNLINVVKASAAHEEETLVKVIEARNAAWEAGTWREKMDGENELTDALHGLFAVAESYPDLQANKNFAKFQDQIIAIEDDIAHARTYYNAVVKMYNTKIQSFPSFIYAKMLHCKKKPMFEISNTEKRKNVEVKF